MIELPEIIILSTQRSGTHLLESFLKNHPEVHGRGEMFLRYERSGVVGNNIPEKFNLAILMYNQMHTFESLGGRLDNHKIIHLLRNPTDVALSRCQMISDKKNQGELYSAHKMKSGGGESDTSEISRGAGDFEKFETFMEKTTKEQNIFCEILANIPHLVIRYEDIVPNNISVKKLNARVAGKLGTYLKLDKGFFMGETPYVKTGIVR